MPRNGGGVDARRRRARGAAVRAARRHARRAARPQGELRPRRQVRGWGGGRLGLGAVGEAEVLGQVARREVEVSWRDVLGAGR